jgi:3''-phosphoadenosine 5''-phosphosulfate sulfotransferase (PAPS reductase)/FAD synthetase and related enzymes
MVAQEPVLTADDREVWGTWIATAALHARTQAFKRHVEKSRRVLDDILNTTPDAAVSWSAGKDSSVMTHLCCVLHGAPWKVYSEKDDLDYPGEEEYVTRYAREWKLDLEILRPPISPKQWFIEHAKEIGPSGEIHARAAGLSKACFYNVMEECNKRHDCSILGLRSEESGIRRHARMAKGLYYQLKTTGRHRAIPISDWSALDVYAYAVAHGIELLPVYRCVAFAHRHEPWMLRKSWWLPGGHAATGSVAWLRRYWPSLYRQLCEWMPASSQLA